MKRALVTGGDGFVGGYMVQALDERGFEVTNVDIASGTDCRTFFKSSEQRYDLVVHLAAIVGGRMTIEGQPLHVASDLSIDADMFGWAVRTKQPHVIYYSSSAAYPVAAQVKGLTFKLPEELISLDDVASPDMTYGWAKLTGEYIGQFARKEGVRVDVFRPFSGYGTDQSLDYPFPSFIKRALDRVDPVPVWGSGQQVRDWVHITDVVEGTLVWSEEANESVTVNLCTGRPTPFIDLVEVVTSAASYSYFPHVDLMLDKPTGVHYRVGDPTKMEELYTPRVTLEEGVARAIKGVR